MIVFSKIRFYGVGVGGGVVNQPSDNLAFDSVYDTSTFIQTFQSSMDFEPDQPLDQAF
jgi:hypothetical protein